MKFKIFSVLIGLAMIAAFTVKADAQYMTQDLIFIKVGYVPLYTVTPKAAGSDDIEIKGFGVQGEYNLNFSGFWMGFGLEYQYMIQDVKNGDDYTHSFLIPEVSIKFAAVGGLYLGAGVSGKYLIATKEISGVSAAKKIDLWANGILGYHMPIADGVFFDLEGRFGWNITNKQFSEWKTPSGTQTGDLKNAYDLGFYAGIGFRAPGSNY